MATRGRYRTPAPHPSDRNAADAPNTGILSPGESRHLRLSGDGVEPAHLWSVAASCSVVVLVVDKFNIAVNELERHPQLSFTQIDHSPARACTTSRHAGLVTVRTYYRST